MYSICQSARPNIGGICMIAPDSGEPIAVEIGAAAMNHAAATARCFAGNHRLRYRMMPGKKPASAMPSRKRST